MRDATNEESMDILRVFHTLLSVSSTCLAPSICPMITCVAWAMAEVSMYVTMASMEE